MADAEPAPGPRIVGDAIRAARRTRRLRLVAAASATAVAVPALAVGVPALAGALGTGAVGQHNAGLAPSSGLVGHAPGSHRARHHAARARKKVASPIIYQFQRPTLPPPYADTDPVSTTLKSAGQLLIADLPASASLDRPEGEITQPGSGEVVYAMVNMVTTRIGGGGVEVVMSPAGATASRDDISCQGVSSDTCRIYGLAGGVRVQEEYMGGILFVTVFKPNVAIVNLSEENRSIAPGPFTKGMPLTIAQALKIAMDPRWQFTMNASFVQQASGLQVGPMPPS
jgi:hypothetical protein